MKISLHENRIPEGATALDAAFIINPTMAFAAQYVQIKKYMGEEMTGFSDKDYRYPLRTVIHDGDVIHFLADYDPAQKKTVNHAELDWFRIVNTEEAREVLIKYYEGLEAQLSALNAKKRGTIRKKKESPS